MAEFEISIPKPAAEGGTPPGDDAASTAADAAWQIRITDRAVTKALQLAEREGVPKVLRLGVQGGGCSGFTYVKKFDPAGPRPTDHVLEVRGLTVVCDPKSMAILKDVELDFDTNLLRGGWRFQNPNARQTCSCGDSFGV